MKVQIRYRARYLGRYLGAVCACVDLVSVGNSPVMDEGSISATADNHLRLARRDLVAPRPCIFRSLGPGRLSVCLASQKTTVSPCPRRIYGRGSVYSPRGKTEGHGRVAPGSTKRSTDSPPEWEGDGVRGLGRITSVRPDASGWRVHRPPQR